jgi:peptide deformylase
LRPRKEFVRITGLDEDGRQITVEGTGLLARAMMHEIDHLDGVLFIDRLSESRRRMFNTRLKELAARETLSNAG